jgi:hypothetical protein
VVHRDAQDSHEQATALVDLVVCSQGRDRLVDDTMLVHKEQNHRQVGR